MVENKINKKLVIGIVLISIILFGITLYTQVGNNKKIQYYYDKELGIITTEIEVNNFFNKIFGGISNIVIFTEDEVNINDIVHFTETETVPSSLDESCAVTYILITINGPSEDTTFSSFLDSPKFSNDEISYTNTFTVTEEGYYNAVTLYEVSKCDNSNIDSCFSDASCAVYGWETPSTDEVSVIIPSGECELTPYCDEEWSEDNDNEVINGKVMKRDCYDVIGEDENCAYSFDRTEYKTICDEGGYVIEEDNQTWSLGIHNCELSQNNECNDDNDCEEGKLCNEEANICVVSDCNDDQTKTCSDGTTITLVKCENGVSISTNESCSDESNNTKTCWKVDDSIQESVISESNCISYIVTAKDCGNNYDSKSLCESSLIKKDDNEINWFLISIIGGIVTIIIASLLLFIKFRTK